MLGGYFSPVRKLKFTIGLPPTGSALAILHSDRVSMLFASAVSPLLFSICCRNSTTPETFTFLS